MSFNNSWYISVLRALLKARKHHHSSKLSVFCTAAQKLKNRLTVFFNKASFDCNLRRRISSSVVSAISAARIFFLVREISSIRTKTNLSMFKKNFKTSQSSQLKSSEARKLKQELQKRFISINTSELDAVWNSKAKISRSKVTNSYIIIYYLQNEVVLFLLILRCRLSTILL